MVLRLARHFACGQLGIVTDQDLFEGKQGQWIATKLGLWLQEISEYMPLRYAHQVGATGSGATITEEGESSP